MDKHDEQHNVEEVQSFLRKNLLKNLFNKRSAMALRFLFFFFSFLFSLFSFLAQKERKKERDQP